MQWARHYLQRTSDFMRENRTPQMSDLFVEDRIARPFNQHAVEASLDQMDRALYAMSSKRALSIARLGKLSIGCQTTSVLI
jgi:hypothetical protein